MIVVTARQLQYNKIQGTIGNGNNETPAKLNDFVAFAICNRSQTDVQISVKKVSVNANKKL